MINMPKYYIGVDVGATKIKAVLVTSTLIVKKRIVFLTEANKGLNVVKSNMINAIKEVWDKNIVSIGVGFPAPVDLEKGVIKSSRTLPGFDNVNLKNILEKEFSVKTFVNNDANCFTLAESKLIDKSDKKSIVGVLIGNRLGSGISIKGELYTGSTCSAGEIGIIPFKGINLEEFAAGSALKRLSTYQGLTMSPVKLAEMAKKNKGFAKNVFKEYGVNLGTALSVLANTFDPDVIVLGGSVSKSFQYFKSTMNETLKKNVSSVAAKNIKVVKSKDADSAALGAAMYAISRTK
tara:strand:- start:127 stop:1002 length:876 start_codon:yes stop_codon:yes gene_type:complete